MSKKILSFLFNHLPIKKRKIVFNSFSGGGYGCNPKYIAEEIIKQKLPCDLVWLTNSKKINKADFPKEIKLVELKSVRGLYELSTANVIVSNVRLSGYFQKGFKKKNNQFYLQTWHGSYGIKKMEGDIDSISAEDVIGGKLDSSKIDCLLSNCKWLTKVYHSSFFYDGKIEEFGSPRNDIFFGDTSKILDKVHHFFCVKNKKIALYAPTFRDDKDMSCYNIDYERVREKLEEKFGGEWIVISRLHPNLFRYSDMVPVSKNVLNGSEYPDMQELLVASNVLVTDYSSCMFDFMLSQKPVFIFATDIEKYNTDRGFYYPLEETPFSIATNNDDLLKNIKNYSEREYSSKAKMFLEEKGSFDKGDASQRCVSIINMMIKD